MSDSKQVQEKWRAEELRAQRKARLAKMKSRDGGKKPIQTTNPASWIITAVIIVIALVVTGIWAAARIGLPQRNFTAVTVDDTKIKAVEVNYYYYSLLSNYGIDPSTDDGKATLKSASGDEKFPIVSDYLKDQAAQQVQQQVLLAKAAAGDGMAIDEADRQLVEDNLASLSSAAAQANSTLDNYLIKTFGTGMSQEILTQIIKRSLLAYKYGTKKEASFDITDADALAYYNEHKNDYDIVNFRSFYLASVFKTGASDAEKTKALEEARVLANEMLGKINSEAAFKTLCIEYAAEADKEGYRTGDKTLNEKKHKADLITTHGDWLFAASRKAGDKTVIESTSGFYVLYFIDRSRADYQHVAVRHILIAANRKTATEAQITTAKTKAEQILAEYLGGAKTETAFGELAKKNSADGNASEGGIYADVAPGQMVREFEDWCFAAGRKTGDTGIVQTDFGFHVMYFVKEAGSDWQLSVEAVLRGEAYQNYLKEEAAKYPYQSSSFGMRYVG